MFRLMLLLCLMAGVFAMQSSAVASTKSYAPENLRQLSYPERIRVIEKEYYEQSGGRDIPDDQLEFYLDSVDKAGWGFNQVRQDIAVSLGNNNNGVWSSNDNWSPNGIICSSNKKRLTQCRTPFYGRAVISQQISDTRCVEGKNWGQNQGMIWVDHGCRARFTEVSGGGGWDNGNYGDNNSRLTCESISNQYRECRTNFRGTAQLSRKISKNNCEFNRDWGSRPGYVWVRNGCRAEFYDSYNGNGYGNNNGYGYGNSNYSVTCASDGNGYKTCPWDPRAGTPRILRQLSKKSCVSGRNWGYDNRGLWVNDGCRAKFGPR